VLVEFKIDAKGRPTDASVLESDAEVLLQTHSLKMLQATLFDVADPRFNPADETPFRVTYKALEEMGLKRYAFEAVILRHPDIFSTEAAEISRRRLGEE